jgi:glutamine synthetase
MANKCFGPQGAVAPFLDHGITRFFLADGFCDQGDKIIAEYVWIGGTMQDVRSKARTLPDKAYKPEDLPHWNYGEVF